MSEKEYLEECIDNQKTEMHRYFLTVHLTLGLKDYLDKNLECDFIAAEKTFQIIGEEEKEIYPDIILQYNNNKNGIVGEIKSSLSHNELYITTDVFEQLNRYDLALKGWNTENGLIEKHDILHFIHMLDSDWYISIYNKYNGNVLNLKNNYCIAEYSNLMSPKAGSGDIILVRYRTGDLGCEEFKQELIRNIQIKIDKLLMEYEKYKFVRKKPPIIYLMKQLWFFILTSFGSQNIDQDYVDVRINEITKVCMEYYEPWSGIEHENSQLRTSWIKEAIDAFVEINLIENIQNDRYRIFLRKQIPKDMNEYIIEEYCKKYVEKHPRKITEEQTKLNYFM